MLNRGFALVRDETGALVRSVTSLREGSIGSVEVANGRRNVQFLENAAAPSEDKIMPEKKKRRPVVPAAPTSAQKTLFD